MAFNFLKSLDADDIFISYSREDGEPYLNGLDAELSKQHFSCFSDKRGTDADRLPPESLFRKVRLCKTLVLLGTPGALKRPEYLTEEIREFAKANGTERIIAVSFDRGEVFEDWSAAPWNEMLIGKAREREVRDALTTGKPTEALVTNIAKASDYMKSRDRLRSYRRRMLVTVVVLVFLGLSASGFGGYESWSAVKARQKAQVEIVKANEDVRQVRVQAEDEKQKARDDARKVVTSAQNLARAQIRDANTQTRVADDKRVVAEALRRSAQAEANREQTIAQSRSLANRAETLLRQHPEELSTSLSLAIDSMTTSSKIGVHSIEADSALRDAMALAPRLSRHDTLPDKLQDIALSPDGESFAILSSDKKLRVFESDSKISKDIPCDCSAIALSNGLAFAAAQIEGGVRIIDLKNASLSHVIDTQLLPKRAGRLALSPGGRFLAFFSRVEMDPYFSPSQVIVLDTTNGKLIQSLDLPDIFIDDIAFGPSGLAVAGRSLDPAQGMLAGRVLLWSLPLSAATAKVEPELTEASFSSPVSVPQASEVWAIALGPDTTSFATETGVWIKTTGCGYEPVSRFSSEVSGQILALAFRSNGSGVEVVRADEEEITPNNVRSVYSDTAKSLELWEARGGAYVSQGLNSTLVRTLGFQPGGQLFATTTEEEKGVVRFFQPGDEAEVGNGFGPGAEDGAVLNTRHDSNFIVTVKGEDIHVWDSWRKTKTTARFGSILRSVRAAAVSYDGDFLALSGPLKEGDAPAVIVFRADGETYKQWKKLSQVNLPLWMAVSANGQRLLTVYDRPANDLGGLSVWDVNNGRDLTPASLNQVSGVRGPIELSKDGRYLTFGDGRKHVSLLDLNSKRSLTLLNQAEWDFWRLTFSPDGEYIAVCGQDGVIHVIRTSSPQEEVARLQYGSEITALAISDNNQYIAAAGTGENDKTLGVRVWLLDPRQLAAEATARLKELQRLPQKVYPRLD